MGILMIRIDSFVYHGELVTIWKSSYANNNRLAIILKGADGEPFATISANLPDQPMADDEFAAKTYSENEGIAKAVFDTGCFFYTARRCGSGYVDFPVWRLIRTERTDFDRHVEMFRDKKYDLRILSAEEFKACLTESKGRGLEITLVDDIKLIYLFNEEGRFIALEYHQP